MSADKSAHESIRDAFKKSTNGVICAFVEDVTGDFSSDYVVWLEDRLIELTDIRKGEKL